MKNAINQHQNPKQQLTIGLLDENGNDEYHGILMEGVFAAAERHAARVIRIGHFTTNETTSDPLQVKMVHQAIHQLNLDGLMYLGWIRAVSQENEKVFHNEFSDLPLFSIGMPYHGLPSAFYDGGSYLLELLLHLLDHHRYKKIAFIAPFWTDSREAIYFKTMKERNLFNDDLYIDEQLLHGLTVPERGRRAVEILLDERKIKPDAIMSLYNAETEGILKELISRGLKVPEDIAVTSYEDGEVGRYGTPPYTTVEFPWYELGQTSCDLFLTQLEDARVMVAGKPGFISSVQSNSTARTPLSVQVPGRLIIRESCGCKNTFQTLPTDPMPIARSLTDMNDIEWQQLSDAIENSCKHNLSPQPDIRLLINSIYQSIKKNDRNPFYLEMTRQLHSFELSSEGFKPDPVLAFLKNSFLPHIAERPEILSVFNDMFMQANALVSNHSLKAWGESERKIKQINRELENAGQKLISQYTMKGLTDTLHESLHRLDISNCLVVLVDSRPHITNRFASCIPIYHLHKGFRTEDRLLTSNSAKSILSEKYQLSDNTGCLVMNLLHVNHDLSGFVLYGPGPLDERVYRALSFHISTSVNNILLTENVEKSYKRLVDNAHKAGMSYASSGILHNIRNVIGSVNTSVYLMRENVRKSPLNDFERVSDLLETQKDTILNFIEKDPRSDKLIRLLLQLEPSLHGYERQVSESIVRLQEKNRLIRDMLSSQQDERHGGGLTELYEFEVLVEDALELNRTALDNQKIRIERQYQHKFSAWVNYTKMLHVLMNIVKNAREAMIDTPIENRLLTITMEQDGSNGVIRFRDQGYGIANDQLTTIFSHGFTTKSGGHGFGLHTSANDVASMGGYIHAESSGLGKGASFIISFPITDNV